MKLPGWFSKPKSDKTETVADVETRLRAAESDYAQALEKVEQAKSRLRDDRSAAAVEAYESAKDDADRVNDLVDVIREDVTIAKKHADEKAWAELEQQRDRLLPELAFEGVTKACEQLVAREVEAIKALAQVRFERIKMREALSDKAHELQVVLHKLGAYTLDNGQIRYEPNPRQNVHLATSPSLVQAALMTAIAELPDGHPMRQLMADMQPSGNTYNVQATAVVVPMPRKASGE